MLDHEKEDYFNPLTQETGPTEYIGDGAYVQRIGSSVLLYTSDGITARDKVYLDQYGINALSRFLKNNITRWLD